MGLRSENIEKLDTGEFDVLVIGGGINGAVSAAALAARGVRTALIDARDFAGFTSQQSSNLVWGGIKYMEGYEFGLVANLCKSRNELLHSFPSTVQEIRFLTTLSRQSRVHPLFMLAGTWLYWLFGRARTRPPRLLSPSQIKNAEPLINTDDCAGGVEYSDAYLHDNDARFVFNFVRNALNHGCVAANYVRSLGGQRDEHGVWTVKARDEETGRHLNIRAKVLVNAAGAFVDQHNQITGVETEYRHIFSKGIHLIVPRLSKQHRVLAFFADDGRLFFAIPMANRTCIGTTDTPVEQPETAVTPEDRAFVLSNINARLDLNRPLTENDIIAERCGVRPLALARGQASEEDFLQLSRKHVVEVQNEQAHISIFGGKLTDCLNVGEEVCAKIQKFGIPMVRPVEKWYGEPDDETRLAFFKRANSLRLDRITASDTGELLSERLWRRYAEQAFPMLDLIENDPRMGSTLIEGSGIRRCELDYLARNELIVRLEDYLRRRSKLELLVSRDTLRQSKGLYQACEILFGENARARYDEYFADEPISAATETKRTEP